MAAYSVNIEAYFFINIKFYFFILRERISFSKNGISKPRYERDPKSSIVKKTSSRLPIIGMLSGISKIPHEKFNTQNREMHIPIIANAVPMHERPLFAPFSARVQHSQPVPFSPRVQRPRWECPPEDWQHSAFTMSVFLSFNLITICVCRFQSTFPPRKKTALLKRNAI